MVSSRDQSPSTTARTEKEPLAHTPGPWSAAPTYRYGSRNEGRIFALGDANIIPKGHAGPVAIAAGEHNARLIALAPELYEYVASSASNGCATALGLIAKATGASEPAGSGEAVATGQTPGGDQ